MTAEISFTTSQVCDPSKEKDWAYQLGLMDWDETKIVFTKRSLFEFLRYTGTTVDTSMNNIAKLPKYAIFGKFSGGTTLDGTKATGQADARVSTPDGEEFKPTRRVREAPGGKSTVASLLSGEEGQEDALAHAPPKQMASIVSEPEEAPSSAVRATPGAAGTVVEEQGPSVLGQPPVADFKPTRRVRTQPGGNSSISDLFGGEVPEFKPTRRVREQPGGHDGVGQIL